MSALAGFDDDLPGPDAAVELAVGDLPLPTGEAQLRAAGQLTRMEGPATLHVEKGQTALRFALPRRAVSLVVLDW